MSDFPEGGDFAVTRASLDGKGSSADTFKLYDASLEDGNLYARALGLGANSVVLATKERTVTYLSAKESAQGKSLMIIIFCFLAAILTCLCVLIAFY